MPTPRHPGGVTKDVEVTTKRKSFVCVCVCVCVLCLSLLEVEAVERVQLAKAGRPTGERVGVRDFVPTRDGLVNCARWLWRYTLPQWTCSSHNRKSCPLLNRMPLSFVKNSHSSRFSSQPCRSICCSVS